MTVNMDGQQQVSPKQLPKHVDCPLVAMSFNTNKLLPLSDNSRKDMSQIKQFMSNECKCTDGLLCRSGSSIMPNCVQLFIFLIVVINIMSETKKIVTPLKLKCELVKLQRDRNSKSGPKNLETLGENLSGETLAQHQHENQGVGAGSLCGWRGAILQWVLGS